MWMWLLFLSWCSLNWATVGLAVLETASKGAADQPVGTTVISQKMTFKNQESQAVFDGCDLADAVFERTVLEKADLRGAINYSIDPAVNRVKKARFSLEGVRGLLGKYDILIE